MTRFDFFAAVIIASLATASGLEAWAAETAATKSSTTGMRGT